MNFRDKTQWLTTFIGLEGKWFSSGPQNPLNIYIYLKILIKTRNLNLGKFLQTLVKEQQEIKILRMLIKKSQSPLQKTTLYKAESLNDCSALHHHLQPQEIKELKSKLTGRAKHSAACSTFPQCHCLQTHEACSPLIRRSVADLQTDNLKLLWRCRAQNAEICEQTVSEAGYQEQPGSWVRAQHRRNRGNALPLSSLPLQLGCHCVLVLLLLGQL